MTLAQLTQWVEFLWSNGMKEGDRIYVGLTLEPIRGAVILDHVSDPEIRVASLLIDEEELLRTGIEAGGLTRVE